MPPDNPVTISSWLLPVTIRALTVSLRKKPVFQTLLKSVYMEMNAPSAM